MSIKIDLESLKTSVNSDDSIEMFPGFIASNQTVIDKITVTPKNGESSESVQVEFNVNYAIVATEASTIGKVIDIVKQGIGIPSSDTLTTVINAVSAANTAINDLLGEERKTGEQTIGFNAVPNPSTGVKECYSVEMEVEGAGLVTDPDKEEYEKGLELANLRFTLKAQGFPNPKVYSKDVGYKEKGRRTPIDNSVATVSKMRKDPFRITGNLTQNCITDGIFIGPDTVSMIHISKIRFIISVKPCSEPTKTPVPSEKEDDKTEPKEKEKKVGLRIIEGVGDIKAKRLAAAGIRNTVELANFNPKNDIEGITKKELEEYLIPSAKLHLSFNEEEVEGLVKAFNAKKMSDVIIIAKKIKTVEDLSKAFIKSNVRFPSTFNPNELYMKLKSLL